MGRTKNKTKMSAAKRRRKALKRTKKVKTRRPLPPVDASGMEGLMSMFAGMLGSQGGGHHLPEPPDWACASSYTPAAAKRVIETGNLPGMEAPPAHHLAKLKAWYGVGEPWGLAEVRACTDQELVDGLALFDITMDEPELRRLVGGHRSAWRLGESLVDEPVEPEHILGTITTELWRRWLPDVPCYEGVCDKIQRGYALFDGSGERSASLWMAAWRDLSALLPPEITSFKQADQATGVLQMLGNWVGDMLDGVHNLALEDAEFVPEALAFVRWIQRFDDVPSNAVVAEEAELLAYLGKGEEGVKLLEDRMAEDPLDPMPYARLSDLFMLKHPRCVRDPARAAQILRDGLARPLREPEHWDLESRLEWAESEA